jgi:hypothetical protein
MQDGIIVIYKTSDRTSYSFFVVFHSIRRTGIAFCRVLLSVVPLKLCER